MSFLISITLPVCLFIFQLWICVEFDLARLIPVYASFLFFYFLGAVFGSHVRIKHLYDNRLAPSFLTASKYFILLKIILVTYFSVIFIEYYFSSGYANIRGYLHSEEIKNSTFYITFLMYIEAYIVVPLNFIFLAIFLFAKKTKFLITLISLFIIQYFIIYASRYILYSLVIVAIFYMIYQRESLFKIFARVSPIIIVIVCLGFIISFFRDYTYASDATIYDVFVINILNYHLVPPFILDDLIQNSALFNLRKGFGLATFGFILDPLISLFTFHSKEYMISKLLSAESQNLLFLYDGVPYNAFATFFYAALFDFGIAGPCLYGIYFGFIISYAYKRNDLVGGVFYVVNSFFVYYNSFMFNITGEWFFVLLIAPLAFCRLRKYEIARIEKQSTVTG